MYNIYDKLIFVFNCCFTNKDITYYINISLCNVIMTSRVFVKFRYSTKTYDFLLMKCYSYFFILFN